MSRTRRTTRRAAVALFALSTGCSAVLGFREGTLARGLEGDPCADGMQGECAAGLTCQTAHCAPPSTCDGGGCAPDGSAPTSAVITSFVGEPGGLIAVNGYVYFTHDDAVYGCSTTQPCPTGQVVYSQPINPRPRLIAIYGSQVAWADSVAGKVSYCFLGMLNRCNAAISFDEPGVAALTTETSSGNLYFVNTGAGTGGESELRRHDGRSVGMATTTIATLPTTGPLVSVVSDGPQSQFVQIGRMAYSVFTPVGADAGPSIVHALEPDDSLISPPAAAAIMVIGRRVVWTRPLGKGGGFAQCPIVEGEVACDPAKIRTFAAAAEEVTAAASTSDRVVWAHRTDDTSDISFCKPSPLDFSERACTPTVLVTGLAGRVSAMTVEPSPLGPDSPSKRVFFVLSDANSGKIEIRRVDLP